MKVIENCPYCEGKAKLCQELTTKEFRKEKFELTEHYYKCEKCIFEFTTSEIDGIDIRQIYNQYREKHKIPSPEQLIEFREKFNLKYSQLTKILGFGANIYANYEKGEIPTLSNGNLLRMIQEPEEFIKMVKNTPELDDTEKEKIIKRIAKTTNQEDEIYDDCLKSLFNDFEVPNQFTGYKKPSLEKFGNMVLFFLEVAPFKVRLNKLLFYADFLHFKFFGSSISGWKYQAIQLGTVPFRYDASYEFLQRNGFITTKAEFIKFDYFEKFISNKKFDGNIFSESELNTLDLVKSTLSNLKQEDIVDINHQETAWIRENGDKNLVSYQKYAFGIKAGNLL